MVTKIGRRLHRSQEGFTLIELLVVVAIIALLATFAVPKLFEAINKSKTAPGQADMNTISSALERYYMDNSAYPTSSMDTDLKAGYVKASTTFVNGFKKGYLYQTNTSGSYYVLVDPRNVSGTVKVVCDPSGSAWTSAAFTVGTDLQIDTSIGTGPTNAQVAAGCELRTWDGTNLGSSALDAQVITN